MSTTLTYARQRLDSVLNEIDRLRYSEFPYPHSEQALDQIKTHFKRHQANLNQLSPQSSPIAIKAACTAVLSDMFMYLPLLGFLLRSTNVRNAFEVYGPLLRLSRRLLNNPDIKLVLSSEWDYSPFTYFNLPILSDFVLIGLPAPESSNPLLLPLAGHELGHSLWAKENLEFHYTPHITQAVLTEVKKNWDDFNALFPEAKKAELETDLFLQQIWTPALVWARYQAQESFCDFVGLRIFRESFLHAFAYLLCPSQTGQRSVLYPKMERRVRDLMTASHKYSVSGLDDYSELFQASQEPPSSDAQKKLLVMIADEASASVIPDLITRADELVRVAGIEEPSLAKINEITQKFMGYIVPADKPECLSNILAAGWSALQNPDLWKEHEEITNNEAILKELVLKTIEALEVNQLLKENE